MTRFAIRRLALPTLAALALAAAGCAKDVTAPQVDAGTPPPVQKPTAVIIDKIRVIRFPAYASGGAYWDVSAIAASRRPDLFVMLVHTNVGQEYLSNTITNATAGTIYTFTEPAPTRTRKLPIQVQYGTTHRIYVMDEDIDGADDQMGWITVNLPNAYRDDNAATVKHTFQDSADRIRVEIEGRWVY